MLMRLALAPKVAVVEEDMVVAEEDKVVGDAPIKERSRITLNPFTGPVRSPAGAFFFFNIRKVKFE